MLRSSTERSGAGLVFVLLLLLLFFFLVFVAGFVDVGDVRRLFFLWPLAVLVAPSDVEANNFLEKVLNSTPEDIAFFLVDRRDGRGLVEAGPQVRNDGCVAGTRGAGGSVCRFSQLLDFLQQLRIFCILP